MVRTGVYISTGNIYVNMSWKHQQKNFIQATFRWIREHITHININNYKIFPINTSVGVTGLFTPAQVTLLASHFVNLECCYKVFMCMVQLEAWLNTQRSQALVALVAGFLPCLFHVLSPMASSRCRSATEYPTQARVMFLFLLVPTILMGNAVPAVSWWVWMLYWVSLQVWNTSLELELYSLTVRVHKQVFTEHTV